jgi:hypothetical protein
MLISVLKFNTDLIQNCGGKEMKRKKKTFTTEELIRMRKNNEYVKRWRERTQISTRGTCETI